LFTSERRNNFDLCQAWKDEHVKVRVKARELSSVFATPLLSKVLAGRSENIYLQVCTTTLNGDDKGRQPMSLRLRAPSEFSQEGWQLDADQLEAILGLWLWTILDMHANPHTLSYETRESLTKYTRTSRIVSVVLDEEDSKKGHDVQEEMDLWLARTSVKFRQDYVELHPQHAYGLATCFFQNSAPWTASKPSVDVPVWQKQRFCGWTLVYETMQKGVKLNLACNINPRKLEEKGNSPLTFRFQSVQSSSNSLTLLDLCCQELFVAMMMSLVDFEDGITEPAALEERNNTMQLQHPIVDTFATAFVEAGLGHNVDALLCIVPALRTKLPSLNPDTIPPKLEALADTYRRDSQWKRAETVLRFGYTRTEQTYSPHQERALRTLCELYRWALSTFSPTQKTFGLLGIKWVQERCAESCQHHPQIADIVDRYVTIAQRFENGQAEKERVPSVGTIRTSPREQAQLPRPERLSMQLLQAIQSNNRTEALFQLCLITPDSNYDRIVPTSALAIAVRNNWVEVASVLLQFYPNPNDADSDGKRAIYHCAERGHEECAKLLYDYDVCLDSPGPKEFVLLHAAVRNHHVGMVKLLLDTKLLEINETDDGDLTPLMHAVKSKARDVTELLLQANAKIEAKNAKGETALFYALESEEMLKILIENGADLKAKNAEGETVLAVAQKRKIIEAVKLLGKDGEDDIRGLPDIPAGG
jgi:ankyrin repeat protein